MPDRQEPEFHVLIAIHQSNLIEGYDTNAADDTSLAAWQWLRDQPELTLGVIRQLQKRITLWQADMLPNQRGYFRGEAGNNISPHILDTKTQAIAHIPHGPYMVPGLMTNWLLDLKSKDSKWMHAVFEYIHPFADGNGRTGRMIMWYDQLQRKEEPWIIYDKDREEYYDILRDAQRKIKS